MAKNIALKDQERRFAQELLLDLDPFAAAKRAGFANGSDGVRLLENPAVIAEMRYLRTRQASRTEIQADAVLQRWWLLATADVNELVQLRRVNCRYCYGANHEYQWTPAEYDKVLLQHAKDVRKATNAGNEPPDAPNDTGGVDFNQWLPPNASCPECNGEGEPVQYVADTRTLSPAGRALYAGVDMTKDGPKLRMRCTEAALLNVAKHLGMHIDRKEVTGPGGEPLEIVVRVVKPPELIDEDRVSEAIVDL